eukprot:357433-Chlamydomonas_euryale.AAC.4
MRRPTHTAERIAEDSGGGDGGNGRSGTRDDWLTSLSPELQSVLRSSRALAQVACAGAASSGVRACASVRASLQRRHYKPAGERYES